MVTPKLRDIKAKPGAFQPGDRILVRTSSTLNKDQMRSLVKSVCKFAGTDVRVLVLNFLAVELWLVSEGRGRLLAGPEIHHPDNVQLGVLNLNCSKVNFTPGDMLVIRSKKLTDLQKRVLKEQVVGWARTEVEVLCE